MKHWRHRETGRPPLVGIFVRQLINPFVICILLLTGAAVAQAEGGQESVIKAVMLRKFVEFIEWPEQYSPKHTRQVTMCVYDDPEIMNASAIFGKSATNSALKYKMEEVSSLGIPPGKCQILFVGSKHSGSVPDIIAKLKSQPILVASDIDGFVEKGGMIGFVIVAGKIRYNINHSAFDESSLKVDAQLLEIANKVVE